MTAPPPTARPGGARPLRYPMTLRWSEPDAAYVAECPDLPGMTADGATYAEAASAGEAAACAWVATARAEGRPVPEARALLQTA